MSQRAHPGGPGTGNRLRRRAGGPGPTRRAREPGRDAGRRGYGARVAAKDGVDLEIAGRVVRLSSPDKVLFSERAETKRDLVAYYLAVGEAVMRAMGGRPVLMQRFPQGAAGPSFFQKRVPDRRPDWLETTTVTTPNGTTSQALVIADLAHVAWAVNLGCLGFHVWPYRAADAPFVDELRIDLDPQPGVGFEEARRAARETESLLGELGIRGFPKTTGNRGIHVYVRLAPRWEATDVRAAAVALARELARRRPDLVTDAWWKEQRGERVFVDFNQNAPHKTVFGAWSVRARDGAQVSMPLRWEDLDDVDPDTCTIDRVPQVVAERGDPWAAIDDEPQSIEPLLAWFRRDLDAGIPDAPWPPVYPKMPGEPPRVAPSRARRRG